MEDKAKDNFRGIKIGIVVKKCEANEKGKGEPFKPCALNPEEHAKFMRNMFSVLKY